MAQIPAADGLLNKDRSCLGYIEAYSQGKEEGAGAIVFNKSIAKSLVKWEK